VLLKGIKYSGYFRLEVYHLFIRIIYVFYLLNISYIFIFKWVWEFFVFPNSGNRQSLYMMI